MDIINRKIFIEYDLKEGKRFNIEDLEGFNETNYIHIEEGYKINFISKKVKKVTIIYFKYQLLIHHKRITI